MNFYSTAFFVTLLSVLQRCLGFLYRIVLSRTIGSEGMGLYQIAVSVFMVILTACSSGIPITVSRLITKYRTENAPQKERSVVSAGLTIALSLTLPTVLVLFLLRTPFSALFSDPRCETVFLLLLPSLSFSAAHTVLRGFFWGNKEFFPYSITELVEEIVMIVSGTLLIFHLTDPLEGAKRAAVAVTLSNLASFTVAFLWFFKKGGSFSSPKGQLKPLLVTSVPITAMRSGASMADSLVAILFPVALVNAGLSSADALSVYGTVTGMSYPVLAAPSSLIGSFALVLVPELAEHFYRKDKVKLKENIEESVLLTSLISCLFIPSLFLFGTEAGLFLFSNRLAGQIISFSAFFLLPLSLNMISSGLLNSMQGERLTFLSFCVGTVFFLGCTLLLPPICGVYSICIGYGAEAIAASLMQLLFIKKRAGCQIKLAKAVFLPLLLCLPALLFGVLLKKFLFLFLGEIPATVVGCILLTLFTLLLYALFRLLPKGILPLPKKKPALQKN